MLAVSDLRALPKTHAVLLATGRSAGLVELQPWYRGPDAAAITARAATAFAQLRDTAADTHRSTRGVQP